MKAGKLLAFAIPITILALYGLFLSHEINLVTADLGRHIRNGEFLLDSREVLSTNFYSYTHPDFQVTNHHWGTGLVFYFIWKIAGFVGVHLFFIILSLATLFIFFAIAKKRASPAGAPSSGAGLGLAAISSLLVIPLLNERTEIRPEVFSYFFSALFFWILLERRYLWLLPLLQIIWVNTHIYFFLGPVIVGVFMLQSLYERKRSNPTGNEIASSQTPRNDSKKLLIILILTLAATLVNPFGIKGALAPLTIFQDYGYRLVENQPVWFIEKLLPNPNYLIYKIVFGILVLSFIFAAIRNHKAIPLRNIIFAVGFSIAGWLAIRNFTIFGFFTIPILAENFSVIASRAKQSHGIATPTARDDRLSRLALGLISLAFFLTLSGELGAIYPYNRNFGLGVAPDSNRSAEFFKQQKIAGPIFNNYDIGGYLIYHLYPSPSSLSPPKAGGRGEGEGVFVDNRPEAYPASFFQEVYIPMQENEEKWSEMQEKYDFNAIFFSHRDYTPWGQKFLINRSQDEDWKIAFADDYAIIFVKNTQ